MLHIGLIGSIGPAATEIVLARPMRRVRRHGQGDGLRQRLCRTHEMLRDTAEGYPKTKTKVFTVFAERLKATGADIVVASSMGGHLCIDAFEPSGSNPGRSLP